MDMNSTEKVRRTTVKASNVRINDWLISDKLTRYGWNVDTIEDVGATILSINGTTFLKSEKVLIERTYA